MGRGSSVSTGTCSVPSVKVTPLGKSTLVAISIKCRKAINRFFFKTEGKTAASGKARLLLWSFLLLQLGCAITEHHALLTMAPNSLGSKY